MRYAALVAAFCLSLVCSSAAQPATTIGLTAHTAGVIVDSTGTGLVWAHGAPDAAGCIRREWWEWPSWNKLNYELFCKNATGGYDLAGWTAWDGQAWQFLELWVGGQRGQPYYHATLQPHAFTVPVELRLNGVTVRTYLDSQTFVPGPNGTWTQFETFTYTSGPDTGKTLHASAEFHLNDPFWRTHRLFGLANGTVVEGGPMWSYTTWSW